MGVEIERKFLLKSDAWKKLVTESIAIEQRYLSRESGRSVRVRTANDEAYITIKGPSLKTGGKPEYEYPVPIDEAKALFEMCQPGAVVKTRHIVMHAGKKWEVDVFHGENDGLIVAEVELTHAGEKIDIPDWAGAEVTDDKRYGNTRLSVHPYKTWGKAKDKKPGP